LFLSDPINFLIGASRRFSARARRSPRAHATLARGRRNHLHPPFHRDLCPARASGGHARNKLDTFQELFEPINQDKGF
jgi:hypothetical protein